MTRPAFLTNALLITDRPLFPPRPSFPQSQSAPEGLHAVFERESFDSLMYRFGFRHLSHSSIPGQVNTMRTMCSTFHHQLLRSFLSCYLPAGKLNNQGSVMRGAGLPTGAG